MIVLVQPVNPERIEYNQGERSSVARTRSINDLSADELRQLLISKRRSERQARLDHYRRTGRVIMVESQPAALTLDSLSSTPILDEEPVQASGVEKPAKKRAGWINPVLSLIEVTAVIGLIIILVNSFAALRNLNQESASLLTLPTMTPTPLVMAVVLPSGHIPPTGSNIPQPNTDEIPAHLQALAQYYANLPIPTPGPEQAQRIQIPAIRVDAPVIMGDQPEQLKKGVGQYIGSPDPGEKGNLVLSAHNDIYGEIFRDLDQLQPGDEIIVYTSQHTYVYLVEQTQIVDETRVDVMAPTKEAIVTLISCYPYKVDNQRIVVSASLSEQR